MPEAKEPNVATVTLQLSDKGTLTVPREFRKKYCLGEGETLTLVDLGGGNFLLMPGAPDAEGLTARMALTLAEDSLTLDDMRVLAEEREKYCREHLESKGLPG